MAEFIIPVALAAASAGQNQQAQTNTALENAIQPRAAGEAQPPVDAQATLARWIGLARPTERTPTLGAVLGGRT